MEQVHIATHRLPVSVKPSLQGMCANQRHGPSGWCLVHLQFNPNFLNSRWKTFIWVLKFAWGNWSNASCGYNSNQSQLLSEVRSRCDCSGRGWHRFEKKKGRGYLLENLWIFEDGSASSRPYYHPRNQGQ